MSASNVSNPLGGKNITEDCKVFSCRMCRKLLFTSGDLMPHDATHNAAGHKKFKWQSYHSDEQKDSCTSLFLDPDSATWVSKESRQVQMKRLAKIKQVKNAIEEEEIFGEAGRPKTPEMSEEQKAELQKQIEEDAKKTSAAEAELKTAADDDDEDSDEEISDDEDARTKQKTGGGKKPMAKRAVAPAYFKINPSVAPTAANIASAAGGPGGDASKKAAPTTAAAKAENDSDSDETIETNSDCIVKQEDFDAMSDGMDEEDYFKGQEDEDMDDDDNDFDSNHDGDGCAVGGENKDRKNAVRIAKAAVDLVDPDTVYCPHCRCKIGTQNWIGSQCSCSAWVTPAFKVHAKAVDEIPGHLYMRLYK